MKDGIINAKIDSTSIGYEDHGILTAYLHLSHELGNQSFGGYSLTKKMSGFVKAVIDTVGVSCWEDLTGKYIKINIFNGLICAIGDIMGRKWFTPADDIDWKA